MDVFTLLEHLKRSPQPPAIIIVSGNADEEEARQLLQRGAFDYVTKPVSLNYLEQAIIAAAAGMRWCGLRKGRERHPPTVAQNRPICHGKSCPHSG